MTLTQSDAIEVKRVKDKGRGVFARRTIHEGEVIEQVPVLVVPIEAVESDAGRTKLWEYSVKWGRGKVTLALGYGSLYNHSYVPNARCEVKPPRAKVFLAIRDIRPGEEITINYNGEPEDQSPLWYELAGD